jgi:glyoxylase-like metal-dependent hydrolase (beta-lactamase superfamily II)
MDTPAYQWLILQVGQLSLQPDGSVDPTAEHACTATLVWPAGSTPSPNNTLLVDPGFSDSGYRAARRRLKRLGLTLADAGFAFTTHEHWDHGPRVPAGVPRPCWVALPSRGTAALPGISTVACPGHDDDLRAVRFQAAEGEVWAVGDAILSAGWLRAWKYYWPNHYSHAEIVQTWLSVARILTDADVVIPGHGPAFEVTVELLEELIASFPNAEHGRDCPEVPKVLRQRIEERGNI